MLYLGPLVPRPAPQHLHGKLATQRNSEGATTWYNIRNRPQTKQTTRQTGKDLIKTTGRRMKEDKGPSRPTPPPKLGNIAKKRGGRRTHTVLEDNDERHRANRLARQTLPLQLGNGRNKKSRKKPDTHQCWDANEGKRSTPANTKADTSAALNWE